MGVLNQYLLEREFMPSYRVNNSGNFRREVRFDPRTEYVLRKAGMEVQRFLDDVVNRLLRDAWDNWDYKRITFSPYGLFQVTLEKCITSPMLLTDILENVLKLQQEFDLPSLLERKIASLEDEEREVTERLKRLRPQDPEWDTLRDRRQRIPDEIEVHRRSQKALADEVNNTLDPSVQWEIGREIIEKFIEPLAGVLHVEGRQPSRLFPQTIRIPFDESPKEAFSKGVSYPLRTQYVVYEFDALYKCLDNGQHSLIRSESPEVNQELISLLENVQLISSDDIPKWAPAKQRIVDSLFDDDASTWQQELCLFSGDNALICHNYPPNNLTLGPSFPRRVQYREYWASVMRGIAYIAELRTITKWLGNKTSDDLEHTSDYRHRLHIRRAEKVRSDMREIAIKVSSSALLVARLRNASMPSTMAAADYAALKFRRLLNRFEISLSLEHSQNNVDQLNDLLSHYDDLLSNKTSLLVAIALSLVTVALPILALPPYIAGVTGSEDGSMHWSTFLLKPIFSQNPTASGVWLGILLAAVVVAFGLVALISAVRVLLWIRFQWVNRLRTMWLLGKDRRARSHMRKRT